MTVKTVVFVFTKHVITLIYSDAYNTNDYFHMGAIFYGTI